MKMRLTQTYIESIKPADKPYWITDEVVKNLRLYVGTGGAKTWYVRYKVDKKERVHKLGVASLGFPVTKAREQANILIANASMGKLPENAKIDSFVDDSNNISFGNFIEKYYLPWYLSHHSQNKGCQRRYSWTFLHELAFLHRYPLNNIPPVAVEDYIIQKQRTGLKNNTINRRVSNMLAALNWATKHGYNTNLSQMLREIQLLPEFDDSRVRYLSNDERARLFSVLNEGENRYPAATRWCYPHYMKALVILSLCTGIRYGNAISLIWRDIDFVNKRIYLQAASTKNRRGYHIPLNETAFNALWEWRGRCYKGNDDLLVFPSSSPRVPANTPMSGGIHEQWKRVLRDANINNFRWHDMRHDFASQLAMKGVDLNLIRELLGHTSTHMTARYAHLSPKHVKNAVAVLDSLNCVDQPKPLAQ
jgi:integrase